MADLPVPETENATRRYADLEKAYIEGRWSQVLHGGQALLDALKGNGDPQAVALLHRVRLLIGHTALYGLGESELAKDHYRAVLNATPESDLRRIASEGLELCQGPRTATAPGPVAEAGGTAAVPLTAADSAAAPGLDPATPPGSEQPEDSGSGDAAQPGLRPEPAATGAIATEPAGAEAPPPWLSDSSSGNPPAPLPADPFQAALAAAGAGAGAVPPDPARAPQTLEPAMPWLRAQSSRPGPQPLEPQAPPAASGAGPGPLAPRLEVEVVEEPELVEVAQSDPQLAEELELELSRIRARRAASALTLEKPQHPDPPLEPGGMAAAASEPEGAQSAGLGTATPLPTVGWELAAASSQGPEEEKNPPAPELASETSAATSKEPIVAAELAATRAVPLSMEDPDLVAGLLGVTLSP
jgi:hypothetical protein